MRAPALKLGAAAPAGETNFLDVRLIFTLPLVPLFLPARHAAELLVAPIRDKFPLAKHAFDRVLRHMLVCMA